MLIKRVSKFAINSQMPEVEIFSVKNGVDRSRTISGGFYVVHR